MCGKVLDHAPNTLNAAHRIVRIGKTFLFLLKINRLTNHIQTHELMYNIDKIVIDADNMMICMDTTLKLMYVLFAQYILNKVIKFLLLSWSLYNAASKTLEVNECLGDWQWTIRSRPVGQVN